MTNTVDPLDLALRRAAPAEGRDLDTPAVHAAIADLLVHARARAGVVDLESRSVARRRGRRTARGIAALSAALLVTGASVAAATGNLPWHTGFFGSPGKTEEGTSEFFNVSSPDLGSRLAGYARGTPLAPGASLDALTASIAKVGGLQQEDGLRGSVATYSACTWDRAWLRAHVSGDSAAQADATRVLIQVPTWPIIARIDGDGGLTASLRQVAVAAASGDTATVAASTATHCGIDQ